MHQAACVDRAKAHGLKFPIENHTRSMIPPVGSFLRRWDSIRGPGARLESRLRMGDGPARSPAGRNPQAGPALGELHVRDIDPTMREYVAIGDSVMGFAAIADAVKAVGFTGFLTLEQDSSSRDMKETCRRYVTTMRPLLS